MFRGASEANQIHSSDLSPLSCAKRQVGETVGATEASTNPVHDASSHMNSMNLEFPFFS